MGKVVLHKINKNCGNCTLWCGDRKIDPLRKCIEVETGTKGKCSKTLGTAFYNSTCNNHDLHPACK